MAKLQSSMLHYGNKFGETSAQAVIRWSVQTCRELAVETEVLGKKAKETKAKQVGAMIKDARNVLIEARGLVKTGGGYKVITDRSSFYVPDSKVLRSSTAVQNWIEMHRTRRDKRTAKLDTRDKMVVDTSTFSKAIKERSKRAGMAKGGWLGAGQDIAKAQIGQDKIRIGKNYLAYAQKHAKFGSSKKPQSGWNPSADITNKVEHSGYGRILKNSNSKKAIAYGLKNTIKFYRRAIRALDKKR